MPETGAPNLPVAAEGPHRPAGEARRLPAVISEFQPDALELEHRAPRGLARLTLYGITGLIAFAVLWASLSSIDEVVVAPGKLVTTEPTIVVQPLETSIIRSIDVAAGDVVHAGQPLATLDATFTQSDVDQQRSRLAALDAQVRRLGAEIDGADYAADAPDTPDGRLQAQLFAQRRAFYGAQLQNFDQQIAAQKAAIDADGAQESILLSRRDTLSRIEAAHDVLYRHQTGSLLNLLTSRDARLAVDASIAQIRGNADEAHHTLARLQADRRAFMEDYRRATMEQLVDLTGKRNTAADELKKVELRRNMVTLTAPADAVVLELAQRSIGSVVRDAEPLVTLVPIGVPLEAEVSINARDVGRVARAEPARIKFDAYPFQKFGTASGTIRTISRDAFPPDLKNASGTTGALPFFKARVAFTGDGLKGGAEKVRLLPGMAVSAEIKVGRRRVISYFLYPLLRGLDDSIREP